MSAPRPSTGPSEASAATSWWTIRSGADAPAVMPTVAAPSAATRRRCPSRRRRGTRGRPRARATSTRRFELDEVSEPTTSTTSASRAIARDSVLPVRGGVADVVRGTAAEGREALAQRGRRSRRSRRRRASSASGTRPGPDPAPRRASACVERPRRAGSTSGASPAVPSTSSWPVVADRGRSSCPRAAKRRASACTFDTSGQVASITSSPRPAASCAHRGGDAVGGEDDGRAVGHLVELLDEDGAALLEVGDDVLVVDDLLADVDRRAALVERELDDVDRAVDAGAERARAGEQQRARARRRAPTPRARRASAGGCGARAGRRSPCAGRRDGARPRRRRRGSRPAAGRRRRRRATPTPCRPRARRRRARGAPPAERMWPLDASGPTCTRSPRRRSAAASSELPGHGRPGAGLVDQLGRAEDVAGPEGRVDAGAHAGDRECRGVVRERPRGGDARTVGAHAGAQDGRARRLAERELLDPQRREDEQRAQPGSSVHSSRPSAITGKTSR